MEGDNIIFANLFSLLCPFSRVALIVLASFLAGALGLESNINVAVKEQVEAETKYAGYIAKQEEEIARNLRYEEMIIPHSLNLEEISGLSNEVKEKLKDHTPETLAQAGRIPGVTPAAVSLLLVSIKKHKNDLEKVNS